ncbi:MAG: hypothetical protein A2341_10325 [Deltaproteobacteria bacterium RIFOXYB12_FULL_58_9]|nr:MAG: hypothetical protein A2341_10325 [Deltaproteobacteria bacterium RIFOXYB12_FULL_58_9]
MDVYCPRCKQTETQVGDNILQLGKCATCGGQVSLGKTALQVSSSLDGAIAMSFVAGSRVAVPIDATFEQTELVLSSQSDQRAVGRGMPPPSPPDDDEDAAMSDNTYSGDDGLPPKDDPFSDVGESPVSIHEQETRVGPIPGFDGAASEGDDPFAVPDLGDQPMVANAPTVSQEDDTVASPTPPPAGAHLQLPSIDFSMPDFGMPDFSAKPVASLDHDATTVDSSAAGRAAMSHANLPAHLQLPSFPDFHMPPVPGEERNISGEISIEGVAGSSFAAEVSSPGVANPLQNTGDTSGDNWAVAGVGQVAPPPLRAPPPLPPGKKPATSQARHAQQGGAGGLPDLPMGLPAFAQPAKQKHDLTLVQSEAALQLAAGKGSKTGAVVIALILLVVLGAGGAVWHFGIDRLAEMAFGPQQVEITKTAEEKADELLFQGKKAYLAGLAAEEKKNEKEKSKQYKAAMEFFREALKTYPRKGDVHRNLAIVLAKTGKQEQAVKEYEFYLAKVPDASDRKEVQKIVDDYEKMQKQKSKRQ